MNQGEELIQTLGSRRVLLEEPLSSHTTFKIGGPARFYFEAQNSQDIVRAVLACRKLHLPYFLLGGGSNVLVSDSPYLGLVIRNKSQKITLLGCQGKIDKDGRKIDKMFIKAESGGLMNALVRYTLDEGLAGLELFLGLPGTVGGAIYINAHWRDHFVGDSVEKAEILSGEGKIKEVGRSYFHFGYDRSILQKNREILLSAVFKLAGGEKEGLWSKANDILESRRKSHHYDLPSAGCIFRNISPAEALRLGTPNLTCSAGFFIEAVGLKGKTIGGAQISPYHTNFIINLGGARASDVVELINLIKAKVKEKFDISLQEEIVYLNF